MICHSQRDPSSIHSQWTLNQIWLHPSIIALQFSPHHKSSPLALPEKTKEGHRTIALCITRPQSDIRCIKACHPLTHLQRFKVEKLIHLDDFWRKSRSVRSMMHKNQHWILLGKIMPSDSQSYFGQTTEQGLEIQTAMAQGRPSILLKLHLIFLMSQP